MSVHWQRISVLFDYPVYFATDVLAEGHRDLVDAITRKEPERRHRLLVVIDDGVARVWPDLPARFADYVGRHADRLTLAAAPIVVPGGERVKNDHGDLAALQARLHALAIDRQSLVVIVGGGAVLDMVGYAAATAHRGVRVIRIPTTVLAQTDSGVSVKNGVNAFGSKNFLGSFAPPFAVVNDRRLLTTLPPRDMVAGMAEAVKVALVRDAAFFGWLEGNVAALAAGDLDAVSTLIERSARLHLDHIAGSGDPFELGSARPLDFGHWAAHKLEILTDHALKHGEAVAIGMVLDARYSVEAGLLDPRDHAQIVALLERLGLPVRHAALNDPRLLGGLADFREHLGGELTITLLAGIGRGIETRDVQEDVMRRAIRWITDDRRAA